ncbi:hypothetical protein AOLI_G00111820 [Acnodon oligacanthus]
MHCCLGSKNTKPDTISGHCERKNTARNPDTSLLPSCIEDNETANQHLSRKICSYASERFLTCTKKTDYISSTPDFAVSPSGFR